MNTELMADFLIWCDKHHQKEILNLYQEYKDSTGDMRLLED